MHYCRIRAHGDPSVVKKVASPAKDWITEHASHDGDGCLTWPFHIGKDGYGRVHRPSNGTLTTAARLMCEVAHGKPPSPIHEAAHSCGKGNLGCVNPRHVYWATPTRNHADKVQHGTTNRGERQWKSKLTTADIAEIRSLLETDITQNEIARRFGVNPSNISDIKRGKKWGWLKAA